MRLLDCFSGIGGFSLGLERTGGFRTVQFIEIDSYCRRVLARHWPGVPIHDDIRTYGGPSADIITAGWPCTQSSVAAAVHGKRTGLAGPATGLVRHALDMVARLRPRWFIGENPPGIGPWEGEIVARLEDAGYRVSRSEHKACDHGAPHERRRRFFLAHVDGERLAVAGAVLARAPVEISWPPPPGNLWRADQSGAWRMDDGLSGRMDAIRALGNAVMPAKAQAIGNAVLCAEGLR